MALFPIFNDRNRAWSGAQAAANCAKWASSDGSGDKDKVDWKKYGKCFFYTDLHSDDGAEGDDFEDFKLGFVDIVDGKPYAIWKGVTACAAAIQGSHGNKPDIPSDVMKTVKANVVRYYEEAAKQFKDKSIQAPWLGGKNAIHDFENRFGSFGGVETRIVPIQVRAADNGDPNSEFSIDGHASVFGQPSLDLGGFTEYIDPNAFERALKNSPDVVANWDHDNRYVLGRTTNGTLKLKADDDGLAYWVRVAPTSYASDLRILMERGDINQASFAFTVASDTWEINTVDGEEVVTRTINEIGQLFDVCVTAQGAYPQTNSQISRTYFMEIAEERMSHRDADADLVYVPEPYHQDPDETLQCPSCGRYNSMDAQFCDQCACELVGMFIVEPDAEAAPAPEMNSLRVRKAKVRARNYKLQQ